MTVPLLWDDEPEPAVVSGVPENGNIVVRWSQPDDWKVLNYKILRRQEQPDGSFEWMALAVDDDTTMWVDKPVTEAGYGYYVWAIDPSSRIKRLESLEVFAGPPPPPKPEKLMLSANHNSVTLTWDEQNSEWITGYEILQTDASYHPVGPSITFETGSNIQPIRRRKPETFKPVLLLRPSPESDGARRVVGTAIHRDGSGTVKMARSDQSVEWFFRLDRRQSERNRCL